MKFRYFTETGKKGVWWFSLIVIYIATRLPLLDVPLDRDEGAFALIAQSILNGGTPYQSIFDHKPPGVFYIYTISLLLLPATASGIHTFLHIWNFGSLLLVNRIASTLFRGNAGFFAALFYLFLSGSPSVQGFSASTENFLLLPMLGSIALLLASQKGSVKMERVYLISAGALGAASCWIKPVAFFPLLVTPLFMIRAQKSMVPKSLFINFAWWLAGGLTLSFAVCFPFFLKGLLGEFYYWSFKHNMLYSAESWSGEIAEKMLALQIPRLIPDFAVPGTLALCGALLAFWQMNRSAITATFFLLLSITGAAVSGYFYNHYFSIMAPAVSILAAFFVAYVLGKKCFSRHKSNYRVSTAIVFTLLTVLLRPWYWINPDAEEISKRVLGLNSFEAAPVIAKYLDKRIRPDQWIYIDGSEPQIAFLANRRIASPFVMSYPLSKPWKRNIEFQRKTWAMIKSRKPEYIIVPWIGTTRTNDKVEPFLEEKLADLVDNNYKIDSVVLEKPESGHLIREGPLSPKEIAAITPDIRFILWRKR